MTPKEEFFRVEAIKYLINLGYPKENFYIELIVKKFGNGGRNSFRSDFAILKKPKSQYNNFDPDEIMKEVILLCEVKRDNAARRSSASFNKTTINRGFKDGELLFSN